VLTTSGSRQVGGGGRRSGSRPPAPSNCTCQWPTSLPATTTSGYTGRGGIGFNFEHSRARFETYAAPAQRFGNIVAQAGADVHIANHTNRDNSPVKMAALEKRKAGDPHPYVVGTDSNHRYLKVAGECARVGALREK